MGRPMGVRQSYLRVPDVGHDRLRPKGVFHHVLQVLAAIGPVADERFLLESKVQALAVLHRLAGSDSYTQGCALVPKVIARFFSCNIKAATTLV